jgi:tRNA(fMet)-specific endonuclease VapC
LAVPEGGLLLKNGRLLIEAYLERLAILDWTNEVTSHYARIRSVLERCGKPIGNMDLLIASHAVAQHVTLVTNNLKHFWLC